MSRAGRLLPAVLLLAVPLAAQAPAPARTLTHYLPFVASGPNSFPLVGAFYHVQRRAPYEARVTSAVGLRLDGAVGFDGTRYARATLAAPLLVPGWRWRARAEVYRAARAGFHGLGPDAEALGSAPHVDRVRRLRWSAGAEVTRHLAGPLHLALAGEVVRAEYHALPGASAFRTAVGAAHEDTDATVRGTLVLDTRTREYDTPAGVLLEAGLLGGSGGDGYHRWHAVARGYLPVGPRTTVAVRLLASDLRGDPPLDPRTRLATWEGALDLLGGATTHRALGWNRYLGTGVTAATLEARYGLLDKGDVGALSLLLFADAGRVFEGERLRFTADDWAVGAGGGVAARLWRSNVATLTLAGGPDGAQVELGGGWMF